MVGHDESGTILGYVWPKLTRCPFCGSENYIEAGGNGRTLRYRFCANEQAPNCQARAAAYKIMAIAAHIDRGGDQSEVVPL